MHAVHGSVLPLFAVFCTSVSTHTHIATHTHRHTHTHIATHTHRHTHTHTATHTESPHSHPLQSTAALPFGTICIIIVIWALITLPLTVLGGIAAKNSKAEYHAPCRLVG